MLFPTPVDDQRKRHPSSLPDASRHPKDPSKELTRSLWSCGKLTGSLHKEPAWTSNISVQDHQWSHMKPQPRNSWDLHTRSVSKSTTWILSRSFNCSRSLSTKMRKDPCVRNSQLAQGITRTDEGHSHSMPQPKPQTWPLCISTITARTPLYP